MWAVTHIFAEAVGLLQCLGESALHGREKWLRVEGREAFPVTEEWVCLSSQRRRDVWRLQEGQIVLLHTFKNSHILPLCADQPTPL